MKTVAHVCVSKGLGGLELYSLQLHEKFKNDGISSIHFCQKNSLFESKLEESGVNFISLNKTSYFGLSNILRFRKAVKEHNIKHVFVHHLKDLWFVVPALKGMDDVEVIGVAQMFLNNVNKKDFLHTKLYGRLKKTMALTEIQKQSLLNCLPLDDKDIQVIPNSVDMEKFKNLKPKIRHKIRSELGILDNEKLIGVVGRLDPWKGQYELLNAFKEVHKKYSDTKLIVIGDEVSGTKYNQKLYDFVTENSLQDNVIFKGFQKNIHEWMYSLDIFVMPSYEEAFGIVLVEAMAAGKPCLSTNAGGVPDIITNNEIGVLVQPRSDKELVRGLECYLSDWDKALDVGKNAQTNAFNTYDMNKIFKEIKSLVNL